MSFVSEHNSLPAEKKRHIVCDSCLLFFRDWCINVLKANFKIDGSILYYQVIAIKVTIMNCEVSNIHLKYL